ncbi:hypothetical protein HELRODRAFT_172351 [Helobdella robusta]|uniref:Ubiquitin carboxyl-terminal hydrolase n=1 Tax=Helobdella robusta TaxID=6412 RepID=T1F578_HELRO|nr:hypothetical protein HELRODRAFT_172351 [Helobdella robusta]ESO04682.1 hypothetical protein HELRODRAFT_172351 [Helobdella robusta]
MAASAGDWCLIESDPGVFTELICQFGVTGVQVEEIWSLDAESFSFSRQRPIYGLIFLFKWKPDMHLQGNVIRDDRLRDIFFAKQVINNACATQAILSILFNCSDAKIDLGETLNSFKTFTRGFDPTTKGLALSNSDIIRQTHNSFAKQQLFELELENMKKDDEAYHFIGYIPINGRLYELDGLQEGPIDHGVIPEESEWLNYAKLVIEQRIQKYEADEIHFSLMAIIPDQKKHYEALLENTQDLDEVEKYKHLLNAEINKRKQYQVENARRRHNFIPFIIEFFKILAEKGELAELMEKAKVKAKDRANKAKASKPVKDS